MRADRLQQVQARAERTRRLLLPGTTAQGDIPDPQARLRDLIRRLGGGHELADGVTLRQAVADVTQFLTVDMPELVQAVQAAQEAAHQARRELSMRAGTKYTLVVTSDAPIGVHGREALPPGPGDCGS